VPLKCPERTFNPSSGVPLSGGDRVPLPFPNGIAIGHQRMVGSWAFDQLSSRSRAGRRLGKLTIPPSGAAAYTGALFLPAVIALP
jgi:hypothetical protein